MTPRIVLIGAGIVGCALADELSARGWSEITVLEQGPLFATGGSTSHAPGLVFQTNPSRTMIGFAAYTVEKYNALTLAGRWAFRQVGGLEVATTPARVEELKRKLGYAASWGVQAELLDPDQCAQLHPLLDRDQVLAGYHTPHDGLAKPLRAAEAQARAAIARGVRFLPWQRVVALETGGGGRVAGVRTEQEVYPADIVVSCAGYWGARIARMAGTSLPLTPMAHQYAMTTPLAALAADRFSTAASEAGLPILRHQDRDLYFREHRDRLGIGSYAHRPMPLETGNLADPTPADTGMPSQLAFTADDFAPAWADAAALLPALGSAKVEEGFNGIFSFTPDGFPLLGESAQVPGCWFAEAVWITHSAGVARAVAEWIRTGTPDVDVHECDLNRFEAVQLAPTYHRTRSCRNFIEVYDIIHPLQPSEQNRPARVSPFYARQSELGAVFLEAGGWERPQWFEANAALDTSAVPARGDWASRYWSPIAGAEAQAARERVALFDMTPLARLEVQGSGALAFLQRMTTNQLDKPIGAVTYTLLLDEAAGVRSDLTVARIGPELFQIGTNGPLDLDWFRRHLPADDGSVQIRDITAGTCCIGVWGPHARDLVQPLTDTDFSHAAFGYFKARQAYVGDVPVTALRVSYVGELGWELYTSADLGLRLWDTLWHAGQPFGVTAAGRSAFSSLRLEKGYRLWGTDMTAEHTPDEAGLGFAVKADKGEFLGREALLRRHEAGPPARRLVPLLLDRVEDVVMGREPVFHDGKPVGYVTSAGFGYSIGRSIAYAWLPSSIAEPGSSVEIEYFGERLRAVTAAEPLFDAAMTKIRR